MDNIKIQVNHADKKIKEAIQLLLDARIDMREIKKELEKL